MQITFRITVGVVFLFFFQKIKRKLCPRRKKIFRGNKSKYWNDVSTCTEDVQNMYRRCTIYLEYY